MKRNRTSIKKEETVSSSFWRAKKTWIVIAALFAVAVAGVLLCGRRLWRASSDGRYENILFLGIDKEVPMDERQSWDNSYGNADAIFLVSLDKKEKRLRIVAIPRDTVVKIRTKEGGEGQETEKQYILQEVSLPGAEFEGQIALQYAAAGGGENACRLMMEEVSELLGEVPISGFVAINLDAIGIINDAVGGVDYTFEQDYTFMNPFYRQGATVHLAGESAVEFLHLRDTARAGTAEERIGRLYRYAQFFLPKAKDQVLSGELKLTELLEILRLNLLSDYSAAEMAALALEALGYECSSEDMYMLEGEIDSSGVYERFYPDQKAVKRLADDLWE